MAKQFSFFFFSPIRLCSQRKKKVHKEEEHSSIGFTEEEEVGGRGGRGGRFTKLGAAGGGAEKVGIAIGKTLDFKLVGCAVSQYECAFRIS